MSDVVPVGTNKLLERTTYEYMTIPIEDLTEYLEWLRSPLKDSYWSEDARDIQGRVKAALGLGYQWIRTENKLAIFEKTTTEVYPRG